MADAYIDPRSRLARLCAAAIPGQGIALALDEWTEFWNVVFAILWSEFSIHSPKDFMRLTSLEWYAACNAADQQAACPCPDTAAQCLPILQRIAFSPNVRWPLLQPHH
jgi:hypothetical protein